MDTLLASRDARVAHQAELLGEHPGKTLLCLTVMLPGPVKRSAMSLKIASAAVEAVRGAFSPVFEELRDLETGYEGYFMVDSDPIAAKKLAVTLEETHPLGRLFDLDVVILKNDPILRTGGQKQGGHPHFGPVFEDGPAPLSREALGLPSRTCIICGRPVRECMRERKHTTEELLAKYDSVIAGYDPSVIPDSPSVISDSPFVIPDLLRNL